MENALRGLLPVSFLLLLSLASSSPSVGRGQGPPQRASARVLDPDMHHLGDDATGEWPEAPPAPEGERFELVFEARANAGEWTLLFSQRSVSTRWRLALNGLEVGVLRRADDLLEHALALPAGSLVDGTNTLRLDGDDPQDDITFGRLSLSELPFRETFRLRPVRVRVVDGAGRPSPARITLATPAGERAPVYFGEGLHQATREGVVYTDGGEARFELPEGEYLLYATRGPEWSLAQQRLEVRGPSTEVALRIERVVDTSGFVACDTHVHTLTFSGHGDSSVEERMVTLAGEGVELAISTDHNHNTDYGPYRARLGLGAFFTSVVGNEVTTPIGHFNAFPLDPLDEIPPYEVHDIVQLIEGIRARGAQVVILNHPRWPSHERGPFGAVALDPFTGANAGPWTYPFDAVELINSTTEEELPMLLFEDWFALLNRGERVSAVGSSDSHTVGDPVGGGRTYVASASDDPAQIDVDGACRAIVSGRSSLSMGIFVDTSARPAGGTARHTMGDLVPAPGQALEVTLRVAAPAWIRPRRATLYAGGEALAELDLAQLGAATGDTDLVATVALEDSTGQDTWLVWVVVGDGIDGPYWPLHNDYTLGATNPIFVDWSGDGVYQSPRETATELVRTSGPDGAALEARLLRSSQAVVLHALDLVRVHHEEEARLRLHGAAQGLVGTHARVADYLEALPEVR